jgi:hypothetical protein
VAARWGHQDQPRPEPVAVVGRLDAEGGAAAEDLGQAAGVLGPGVLQGHHRGGEGGGEGGQHLAEGVQATGGGDQPYHPKAVLGLAGEPGLHRDPPRMTPTLGMDLSVLPAIVLVAVLAE